MGRSVCLSIAVIVAAWPAAPAGLADRTPPQTQLATDVRCAAELGRGDQTRRQFCDVVIAARGSESIIMPVPPHAGEAVLLMDLHNRFTVPAAEASPADAFERHTAVVAVVRPTGEVIDRAAVAREFRTVQDLFDRVSGGGRQGGVKGVAPGPPESVRVRIPEDVNAIGIVGVRLELLTGALDETFDAPGRPVAVVSNLRIEYTPRHPW